MEDRNFMKFETQTNNRVVDYQKKFGKDLSAFARARSKNVRVLKIKIGLVTAEIFLIWTNEARTNVKSEKLSRQKNMGPKIFFVSKIVRSNRF